MISDNTGGSFYSTCTVTWGSTSATTGLVWNVIPYTAYWPEPTSKPEKEKKKMNIYVIFLVDAVENELILGPVFTIAKDEQSAGANLDLRPEQKKALSKGDYVLVTESIASYEPVEISYVRTK